MQIVYARQAFPESVTRTVFLAGPTPRDTNVASWRPQAIASLAQQGFDGTVFVPEPVDGGFSPGEYEEQITWELHGLSTADCVLFWIPREMQTMPALTTNVEFGMWFRSGRAVLGAPEEAPRLRYLRALAERYRVPQATTLEQTVAHAIETMGTGALRVGAERQVPLLVWRTREFQRWYTGHAQAGNRLDAASLEWIVRTGPDQKYLFFWALKPRMWVGSESRYKQNELVMSRTDLVSVVAYQRGGDLRSTLVALAREYRSAGASGDGFVRECPGGTSFVAEEPLATVALHELEEEIGLRVTPERLQFVGSRQQAGTLCAHHVHVFTVELDAAEIQPLRENAGHVMGADDGERTTVEIHSVGELIDRSLTDWTTLGCILAALEQQKR